MGSGGARPNSGRKKKDTVAISVRLPIEQAEAVRSLAKEQKITLAEAIAQVMGSAK
jgi:hypothetical protein